MDDCVLTLFPWQVDAVSVAATVHTDNGRVYSFEMCESFVLKNG